MQEINAAEIKDITTKNRNNKIYNSINSLINSSANAGEYKTQSIPAKYSMYSIINTYYENKGFSVFWDIYGDEKADDLVDFYISWE